MINDDHVKSQIQISFTVTDFGLNFIIRVSLIFTIHSRMRIARKFFLNNLVQTSFKLIVSRNSSFQMEAKNRGKAAAAKAAVDNHVKVKYFLTWQLLQQQRKIPLSLNNY